MDFGAPVVPLPSVPAAAAAESAGVSVPAPPEPLTPDGDPALLPCAEECDRSRRPLLIARLPRAGNRHGAGTLAAAAAASSVTRGGAAKVQFLPIITSTLAGVVSAARYSVAGGVSFRLRQP